MNRVTVAVTGAAGLLAVFLAAAFLYEREEDAEVETASADHAGPPFLREGAPTLGARDARVVLVEFFDPGCEACRAFAGPVKQIVESYPGQVRLVLRYIPLHQGADVVVRALEASRSQGKYWETLELVFERQPEWAAHHHPNPEALWPHLPSVGLDVEKLREDMRSMQVESALRRDMADAAELGVQRTPTFFVNGRPLEEFGLSQLQELVQGTVREVYGD